jgi:GMP synthase-like glutamine amidotransferase
MDIGILQCDSVNPNLQGEYGDYPDMYHQLLTTDSYPGIRFTTYNLTKDYFPKSVGECDAWLFSGSKWSAYDADEWIATTHQFIRELHAKRRPTIGICFGHQLICRALGGTVGKSDVGWGIGVQTTRICNHRPWMDPRQDTLSLVVSHQDQVLKAPVEATLLAGHSFCPHDMFQIGEHMLTMQGHPEYSKAYGRALMDMRRDAIGEPTYQQGIDSLEMDTDSGIAADWILRFLQQAS